MPMATLESATPAPMPPSPRKVSKDGRPCESSMSMLDSQIQPDSIPSHPLGVKPLGNQFLSSKPSARANIGNWAQLPDEAIFLVLEQLNVPELLGLGSTCRFLYALCAAEELWKSIFLVNFAGVTSTPVWRGSWRKTVLNRGETGSIDCSSVFSDVLHRPFACGNVNLKPFVSAIPNKNQIRRFAQLSNQQFSERWAEEPFILTDCIQDWPACQSWSLEYLLQNYGDVCFRAEAVDWPLSTYWDYLQENQDESPLYLFDRYFAEKMKIRVEQREDSAYWRPSCFGPDYFDVLGKERPAHRWLIAGPKRSGSTFHKDPNGTSAWNAVLQGRKYWIMFPPQTEVPGVYVSKDSSEVTSPLSIAEWLLTFHAEARQTPGCIEGVCQAGEILHVPSGWWHLVVNLDAGVALTQNFVPRTSNNKLLSAALSFLRDKSDQVSGFSSELKDPYKIFVDGLKNEHPDDLREALELLSKSKRQKRSWATAIGKGEEQGQRTSFSFNFSIDNDNE